MQIIPVSTSVSYSLTFRADHAGKYINKGFIHTVHTMLVSTSVNYSLVSTSVSYSPIVPYTVQIMLVSTSACFSPIHSEHHAGGYIGELLSHTKGRSCWWVYRWATHPYTVQIMLVSTSVSYSPIHSAGHAGEYISELLTKHRADHAGEYISGLLTHTQGRSCWWVHQWVTHPDTVEIMLVSTSVSY